MKDFGIILIVIGIIAMIVISFLDVSVSSDYGKASNFISKMNFQQNYMFISGVITILGGILFGAGLIVEQIKVSANEFLKSKEVNLNEKVIESKAYTENKSTSDTAPQIKFSVNKEWECPNCHSINIKPSSIITFNGLDIYQCQKCKQKFKSES